MRRTSTAVPKTPSSKSRQMSANNAVGLVKAPRRPTLSGNPKTGPSPSATPKIPTHPVHPKIIIKKDAIDEIYVKEATTAPLIMHSRNTGSNCSDTLLNKPTNPETPDLSKYQSQTRAPKSTGFHRLHSSVALPFLLHGQLFGPTLISPPSFTGTARNHSIPPHLTLPQAQ